jgi:hypothetical protein
MQYITTKMTEHAIKLSLAASQTTLYGFDNKISDKSNAETIGLEFNELYALMLVLIATTNSVSLPDAVSVQSAFEGLKLATSK